MSARFLFTFAVQMQAIVIGWRMYDLTHDPLSLGFIGLAEALPALSLALLAGHIVDQGRPMVIYRRVMLGSLLSALVLLASQSQHSFLQLTGSGPMIALYVSSFITGIARSFSQPAIFATVPRIVPRQDLPRASAWMGSTMQIARIMGPAVGGLTFGWLGVGPSAGIICAFLLLGVICLIVLGNPSVSTNPPKQPTPSFNRKDRLKEELLSGAAFVFRHPILLPALSLDMISVLFGGVTALLPIFAGEILQIGPKGLGLLRAAPAIGAALMGLWLTRLNFRQRAGTWLFWAVTGFGLSILVFGLSRNFLLSALALGLSGAFDSVSMVVRSAAVQLASPDELRGRISAVNSMFIGSSNEIGEFESGVAAKLLGTVPAVVLGGGVCLLTVALIAARFPQLRKLNLDELKVASH